MRHALHVEVFDADGRVGGREPCGELADTVGAVSGFLTRRRHVDNMKP